MTPDHFSNKTIGIIGGGHLGRALALSLISRDFPAQQLMLSYGGNPVTRRELLEAGLESCIMDNPTICRQADIIFLALRPQSAVLLREFEFRNGTLVVSCMAGISTTMLSKTSGVPVIRMMPSGPATLLSHDGIVGIYPHNMLLEDILSFLGQHVHVMPDEELMHVFTAGVCLPAAIRAARSRGIDTERGIQQVIQEFPVVAPIYSWAAATIPRDESPQEREEYIRNMSTKAGITEAFVTCIRSGSDFSTAFHAAIDRSRTISRDTEQVLI